MAKVGESFLERRTKARLGVVTPSNPNFPRSAREAHWEHIGNYEKALRSAPDKKSSEK